MDLTKKLSFSSTFLKVYLVLGKKIRKISTSFSKLITETTETQSGNIWKDQCLAEVVYIYAWQQHTYQWPHSFRKNSQIWHLKLSVFQEFGYFPLFIIFFPKLCWYSQRFYNSKNLPIRKNSQTPRGLELHEFNCIVNKINKTIGLLPKCKNFLPRKSLLTIYKPFIRPHLDYGDIIYDQTYNTSFIKDWIHFSTMRR